MMKTWRWCAVWGLLALLAAGEAHGQFGKRRGTSRKKASVDLVANVESVVPGQPFEVGIRFRLVPGWHIYWQNSGDSGLPPRVKWDLPDGFTVSDLRFPVPTRHVDATEIVTNIHEGHPMLLATVTPPSEVSGDRVTLAADVTHLVCKTQCLREQNDVKLELPVAPMGSAPKPANADLFAEARAALPSATSKHLTVRPQATVRWLEPKLGFDLVINLEVAAGYVLPARQDIKPGEFGLDLFINRVPGVYFDRPKMLSGETRKIDTLGDTPVYAGPLIIKVPGETDEDVPDGPVTLGGVIKFRACKESGECLPDEAVSFAITVGGPDAKKLGAANTPTGKGGASGESADAGDVGVAVTPAPSAGGLEGTLKSWGLGGLLLGCFLYGLFINATPCVLPLLSIKVLGFVQQAHEFRRRTLMLGLAFGAGVMIFFVLLGLLASSGGNILQYPAAIVALGGVVMALALSMLGVYTLQAPAAASTLEANIRQEGMLASFGKGALAPVLGFACTGPLLAGAFGWATKQPPTIAIIAFLAAGLGMASPYMVLGANPNWLSFLPKPGNWMITFERIMGFLLLGMVLWLVNPLAVQLGQAGLQWTLGFFVAIAMACWVLGRVQITMPVLVRWKYRGSAAAIVVLSGTLIYGWIYPAVSYSAGIPWRVWSAEAVSQTVRNGSPAFVDVTAAWCTVCKANKKLATNTEDVRKRLEACGVVPFQADYTREDPAIAETLRRFDRAGPPLNLIYPPGKPDEPLVLNTNLTKSYLLGELDKVCGERTASTSGS